jgi:hypothetical protein
MTRLVAVVIVALLNVEIDGGEHTTLTLTRTHASNSKVSSEFSAAAVFYRISYVNCSTYRRVIIFGRKLCASFISILFE